MNVQLTFLPYFVELRSEQIFLLGHYLVKRRRVFEWIPSGDFISGVLLVVPRNQVAA